MNIKCFLVGGAVRDLALGIVPKDKDYVLTGMTKDAVSILEENGFTLVGEDFPVYLHPVTNEEFALARYERKTGAGYRGFVVDTSADISITDDLARRDLTINSMAIEVHYDFMNPLASTLEPITGDIIDPFGGMIDIANKMLRHTTNAFAEDPVRVLRIARFSARYGFEIHESTKQLIIKMQKSGELKNLVADRIQLELCKAAGEKIFSRFIDGFFTKEIYGDVFGFEGKLLDDMFEMNRWSDRLNFISDPNHRLAVAFAHVPMSEMVRLKFKNRVIKLREALHVEEFFNLQDTHTDEQVVKLFNALKRFGVANHSNAEFTDDFWRFIHQASGLSNSMLMIAVITDLQKIDVGAEIEKAGITAKSEIKDFVANLQIKSIKKSLMID